MEVRESSARGRRRRGAEGWAAVSGQEYLWERTGSGRSPDVGDMVRVPGLGPEFRSAIVVGREAFAAAAFGRDGGVIEHELLVQDRTRNGEGRRMAGSVELGGGGYHKKNKHT